jgi:hypothetical protein
MTPEDKATVKRGMATKRPEEFSAMEFLLSFEATMQLSNALPECEKQGKQKYGEKAIAMHPIDCKGRTVTPEEKEPAK